jgi:hypothetical protein
MVASKPRDKNKSKNIAISISILEEILFENAKIQLYFRLTKIRFSIILQ